MANATKILFSDLGFDLNKQVNENPNFKLSYPNLHDLLVEFDTYIQNLKTGYTDSGVHVIDRVSDMETEIETARGTSLTLDDRLVLIEGELTTLAADPEEGNYSEVYTYDAYGNVSKETVTGDKAYTVDYIYADASNGKLDYSEKKYTDSAGAAVTIKKAYTYDANDNIQSVATTTTKV